MMTFALSLLLLINAERIDPLLWDAALTAQAQSRAEYLCDHAFSHDGWTAWVSGWPGYVGENLARGFKTAKRTHKALMASPTHRANIVSERYTKIGIGRACGVTVQLFAQ